MTGLTLAHYRIDAELGRGGMGIVYKATDTKLNRTVALKVLPAAALSSDDDRARFFREAQSAAQLHHPNIATVFGIDEAVPCEEGKEPQPGTDSRLFIAMEFIEGQTVADRIKEAPLPLKEAVSIAGQVAEALKEAHGKVIVHRDIKSANVMLTGDGIAKVLDFGLAKTNQSTMLTRMGSTLGTVAYMSPEQARGQEVDGRTDLYALGTMLYEMVAGRLPFSGDYEQAVMYAILNEEPDPLTALRTGVPMELERITGKLLAKEAEYRYQSAAGLLADLKSLNLTERALSGSSVSAMQAAPVRPRPPAWVWLAICAALLAGAGAAWLLIPSPAPPVKAVGRYSLDIDKLGWVAWAPDESGFYYSLRSTPDERQLHFYELATGASRAIPGTENAMYSSVSADGRWLAFSLFGGGIKRVLVNGGTPSNVSGDYYGFGFSDDPRMVLWGARNVAFLDANGSVEDLSDELPGVTAAHYWSGPDRFVYRASRFLDSTRVTGTWTHRRGDPPALVAEGYWPVHASAAGSLLLYSLERREPAAVVRVDPSTGDVSSITPFLPLAMGGGISPTGNLIYLESLATLGTPEPLAVLEQGVPNRELITLQGSDDFSFSPDGRFIAMEAIPENGSFGETMLYRVDVEAGTSLRFTQEQYVGKPAWSPDGEWIYFPYGEAARDFDQIGRRRADGSGGLDLVVRDTSGARLSAPTISRDGSKLAYVERRRGVGSIAIMNLESGATSTLTYSGSVDTFRRMSFSPDGRYLSFGLREDSRTSLIIAETEGGGRFVAAARGGDPVWSRDGDYLYFYSGATTISRLPVTTDPVFATLGSPEVVYSTDANHMHYDVMPNGSLVVSHPLLSEEEMFSEQPWLMLNFDQFVENVTIDMER